MSIQKLLEEIASRYPQFPEDTISRPQRDQTPIYRCSACGEANVAQPEDLCSLCVFEKQEGYQILNLLGRLANSFQRDTGIRYHAVPFGSIKALCGAKPRGRRSVGWSFYHGEHVTCPRCVERIEKRKMEHGKT